MTPLLGTPANAATAKRIGEKIRQAEQVVVALHPYPDGDSIGSCLGFKHLMEAWGKKVIVFAGDSPLPQQFSFLPGFNDIIHLPLTLTNLTAQGAHPTNTICIALDVSSLDRISADVPSVQAVVDTFPTYGIDHHVSNAGLGRESLIIITAAATAEMLIYCAEQWNIPLTPAAARCFIFGLYTDTGGFRHSSTTAHTLICATTCATLYGAYTKDIAALENNRPRTDIILQGLAFLAAEEITGGGGAMAMVPYETLQKYVGKDAATLQDVTAGMASAVATTLKSVQGWNIVACGFEIAPHRVKVSFRSRDGEKYDVSAVATSLGGGGHKAAAATKLAMPFAQAVEQVRQAMMRVLVHSSSAK